MYLYFLLCVILFIPHFHCLPATSADTLNEMVTNATETQNIKGSNNTKLALITEGGSVEPEPPVATLPKEIHSSLINLDKEIGKTKVKSIVPRKGVKYDPLDVNITETNFTMERMDTTILEPKPDVKVITDNGSQQTKLSTKPYLPSSTLNTTSTTVNNTTKLINKETSIPKKPLVLSAEAIMETDKRVAMEKAKLGTSSKPIVRDQLPLPSVKYEQMSSSSHPGMIMPIVITMLVVPMFAVLGYMALRRGQEAWKNRHYKRMDFLLDGMYND